MRRYGDEGYTVFCTLNVPEDGVEYDFFTIISIDPYLFMRAKCRQPRCRQPKCRQNVDNQNVDNQMNILMSIFLILIKISFLILVNGSCKCFITV